MTAERLARIHAAAFEDEVAGGSRSWSAAEFEALLGDKGAILCETPDPALGFALGRAHAGEAEVLTLAVVPAARRRGLARALLGDLLEATTQRGAQEIFLEVAEDNAAARALYARAGFVERGRRPAYYTTASGGGVDALVMSRLLTG